MKKLLISALLAISSMSVHSADFQKCKDIANYAETIMTYRVNGALLSDVLDKYKGFYNEKPLQAMVLLAYEKRVPLTKEYKDRTVYNFRSYFELLCYKQEIAEL